MFVFYEDEDNDNFDDIVRIYNSMVNENLIGICMEIRESAEDYLEAILRLSRQGEGVRSIDVATMLGVSKPSVSHAMKLLREDGYIAMDRYGTITLLDKGAEIANNIYERHRVLSQMLESIGVSKETALTDACKMEHDISQETFEKIKEYFFKNMKEETE